jgi:predicted TPR repeat methyltransferase
MSETLETAGESLPTFNDRREDSLAAAREAALTRPDDAGAQARFGAACLRAGRLPEAIEALQRAALIDPDSPAIRLELARAWLAAADPEKAAVHLRRVLAADPGDKEAQDLLAASERAPALTPEFVRALFDQYAGSFDADMAVLAYRAPEVLRELWLRTAGPSESHALGAPQEARVDILDLGCGTGLAGLAFRPVARTLAGVDLAPAMVAKARARGIYDRIDIGDMTRALADSPAAFDLVLAADALGYVGDLAPLFGAARRALRAGGCFIATVEKEDGDEGFVLGPARRFRHGEAYVRRAAAAAGLAVVVLERCELRRDRGQPVTGLAFILKA